MSKHMFFNSPCGMTCGNMWIALLSFTKNSYIGKKSFLCPPFIMQSSDNRLAKRRRKIKAHLPLDEDDPQLADAYSLEQRRHETETGTIVEEVEVPIFVRIRNKSSQPEDVPPYDISNPSAENNQPEVDNLPPCDYYEEDDEEDDEEQRPRTQNNHLEEFVALIHPM